MCVCACVWGGGYTVSLYALMSTTTIYEYQPATTINTESINFLLLCSGTFRGNSLLGLHGFTSYSAAHVSDYKNIAESDLDPVCVTLMNCSFWSDRKGGTNRGKEELREGGCM